MIRFHFVPFLLQIALAAQQPNPELLTNDSVLKMVRSGLSESVITEMVRARPGKYNITTDQLIQLKREGVPSGVLSAMVAKGSDTLPASEERAYTMTAPGRSGEWSARDAPDKMTGEPAAQADATFNFAEQGSVHVTATCKQDRVTRNAATTMPRLGAPAAANFDTRGLYFRFQYRPASPTLELKTDTTRQTVTTNSWTNSASVTAPHKCVFMDVMVNGHGLADEQSTICDTSNVAGLSFGNLSAQDVSSAIVGDAGKGNDGMRAMTNLLGSVAEMSAPTVASMRDVMQAKDFRVLLPLSNGESIVLQFNPSVPSFQRFAKRCQELFPDGGTEAGGTVTTVTGTRLYKSLADLPGPDPNAQYPRYIELGEYLHDGHRYTMSIVGNKPLGVWEFGSAPGTQATGAVSFNQPTPRIMAGDAATFARINSVLQKYLAEHPEAVSPLK